MRITTWIGLVLLVGCAGGTGPAEPPAASRPSRAPLLLGPCDCRDPSSHAWCVEGGNDVLWIALRTEEAPGAVARRLHVRACDRVSEIERCFLETDQTSPAPRCRITLSIEERETGERRLAIEPSRTSCPHSLPACVLAVLDRGAELASSPEDDAGPGGSEREDARSAVIFVELAPDAGEHW